MTITGILIVASAVISDAGIQGSKHDMGSGDQNETCAFCHTPHGSKTEAPLWNRNVPDTTEFTMYSSPTMDTSHPDRPNGISLACLSCHDGVNFDTQNHYLVNTPGSGTGGKYRGACNCHDVYGSNPSLLTDTILLVGTDLSDDHPISMPYPSIDQDDKFKQPTQTGSKWFVTYGGNSLPLYDGANKNVECPSCHNVHDNTYIPFLRASNAGSSLCTTCHEK